MALRLDSNHQERSYTCCATPRRRKRRRNCCCLAGRSCYYRTTSMVSNNSNLWTTGLFYCLIWMLLNGCNNVDGWWWWRGRQSSSSSSSSNNNKSSVFVTAWSLLGLGTADAATRIQPQQAHGLAVAGGGRVVPFVQAAISSDASTTSSGTTTTTTASKRGGVRASSHHNEQQQETPLPEKSAIQEAIQEYRSNFPWGWLPFGSKKQNEISSAAGGRSSTEIAETVSTVVAAQAMNDLTQWNRRSQSVHMQLNPPPLVEKESNNNNNHDPQQPTSPPHNNNKNATKTVRIITYKQRCRHGLSSLTWTALNTSPTKFQAFLRYRGVYAMPQDFTTQQISMTQQQQQTNDKKNDASVEAAYRAEWRELWKQERLLTDRTELLAVYPSDTTSNDKGDDDNSKSNASKNSRRGGFVDHLYLYVDRLLGILRDEQDLAKNATITTGSNNRRPSTLSDWLVSEYGETTTRALYAAHLCGKSEVNQLAELKSFLEWFRSEYPYYYDRCGTCGASLKEELAARANGDAAADTEDGAMDDEADRDDKCFLGYIYPNSTELVGKASRTELYQCHRCSSYTRFPRYNSAFHVIDNRRGRCGEYSVLLFEILRALGHEARWVVDWTDHVWVEIKLIDTKGRHRWIHLDPCEAAVNENYLYQGWGKKQTYILAFYAPRNTIVSTEKTVPLIQDVTQCYTTDSWKEICKRRDESEENVRAAIDKAASYLRRHLEDNNYAESSVKLK